MKAIKSIYPMTVSQVYWINLVRQGRYHCRRFAQ